MAAALAAHAAVAFAQSNLEVSASAPAVGELAGARLRWGVSLRSGGQQDLGPGLTYSGMTPNDVALTGWYFGAGHFGGALHLQREGFGLFSDTARVTQGSLFRAHLGPSARIALGAVRLEALVGYGFAQLPLFGVSVDPQFALAQRHAVLLASRALVDLGPLSIEGRGEFPVPIASRDSAGQAASTRGFAAGGGVGVNLFESGQLAYGALAEYQLVQDSLTAADGTVSSQTMQRVGLSLEARWVQPKGPPPPRVGALLISIVDADTGAALAGAQVQLSRGSDQRRLTADEAGKVAALTLEPGEVVVRASVGGYLPAEATGTIVAGVDGTLELRAKKEPPKVGSLVITVVDRESGTPLSNAVVTVKDVEHTTSEAGVVDVADLPPGPVQIAARLEGYQAGQEVASVVVGKRSEVKVQLLQEKKRALATITGLVRSARGGAPVNADLEIPQLKLKTKASAQGAFTFKLLGGTYSVNISAPGYVSQSKNVTVKDGDQAIFNVDLHPK
ncbi:MAG: MSCRAMM family protein [Myxococcota bacterium]